MDWGQDPRAWVGKSDHVPGGLEMNNALWGGKGKKRPVGVGTSEALGVCSGDICERVRGAPRERLCDGGLTDTRCWLLSDRLCGWPAS